MLIDTGASLRVAQAKNKVTGIALGKAFGVHPPQVQRWRNSSDMKISLAKRLADHFGITLSEFLLLGSEHE